MADSKQRKNPPKTALKPGPARLYVLLAGIGLALLGVLGFFYDSSFGTGSQLASDDLAGILNINGWRNVIYLVTGTVALALGPRFPRAMAVGLGTLYMVFGLWGLAETERDIGSLLDAVPLGDTDNALHLIVGGSGLIAALADGAIPALPKRRKRSGGKREEQKGEAKSASAGRRRSPAGPRGGGAGAPR